MLTESARVTRRDGNRVELELRRNFSCDHCELSQGCGTGALARLLRRRSRPLIIETDQPCSSGDEVLLVLPESSLVRASLTVYGLPLLGMALCGLLVSAVTPSDWLVAIAAIAGFFAGLGLAAFSGSRLEQRGMAPYIRDIGPNSRGLSRS
jgi:sigma-E factor negative regulatory protein RseC